MGRKKKNKSIQCRECKRILGTEQSFFDEFCADCYRAFMAEVVERNPNVYCGKIKNIEEQQGVKKMNSFQKMIAKIDENDIEEAQTRDYNAWLNYLVAYPQGLYDMLHTHTNQDRSDLSPNEERERKAILDAAFVYIQSAMEDISVVLNEKYPKDMLNKHNRINI